MVLSAADGKPLPIYGAGTQVRDWMHVDDHVRGLRAVATRGAPGESYLLSARNPLTNVEIVHRICAVLDGLRPHGAPHDRLISHVADRPGHDLRYASDPSKAETELGWRAAARFEASLADTVGWYLNHEEWCAATQERYQRGRLGQARAAQ